MNKKINSGYTYLSAGLHCAGPVQDPLYLANFPAAKFLLFLSELGYVSAWNSSTARVMDAAQHRKYNIAFATDFFYPNKGGIETHVRTIGEELCKSGHKVIVITHRYKSYVGCMKIGNLTVYYLDVPIIVSNAMLPSIFSSYPLYKKIFDMHAINIVHGHQTMSTMCMEAIHHANYLGIKTVMTDHSVFEFGKFERIICDGLSYFICRHADRAICVSNIAKINTGARTAIPPEHIKVIPNGIVPEYFYPKKKKKMAHTKIRVLFCARLVFRKGIDLLVEALPIICRNKDIEVIIVGDGPKKDDVEQMLDEAELHSQVRMLGEMNYLQIADVMRESDIFLNTSLTETFCMAILEAASCGLLVVSTNVGGIHEVLDEGVVFFCKPTPEDIAEQIFSAARSLEDYEPGECYAKILAKYDWKIIAEQTTRLYDEIPEKKICVKDMIGRFPGYENFLCRLGTWFQLLQMRILDYFE